MINPLSRLMEFIGFSSVKVVKWDKPLPYVEGYKDTNAMKKGCQRHEVLSHLMFRGKISSIQAIELYGITRLASRIYELKNDYGLPIQDEWQNNPKTNKQYKVYYMKKENV